MEKDHTPDHHSAATSRQKASPSRLGPQGKLLSPSAIQHKRGCTVTFKENTDSPVLSKPRRPSTPIPSRSSDPELARDKDAQKSIRRTSSTHEDPQRLRPAGDIARLLPSTPSGRPRTIKFATPSAIAESLTVPELKTRRVFVSDRQSDRVDDDDIVGDDPQFTPCSDAALCDEEIVVTSEDSSSPNENISSRTSEEDQDEPRSLQTPAGEGRNPHQLKTPLTTPLPGYAKRAPLSRSTPSSRVRLTLYGTPMTSATSARRRPTARRYLGHSRTKDTWTIDSLTPASRSLTPSATLDSTPSQESVLIRNKRPGGYKWTVEKENCDAMDALVHDSIKEPGRLDISPTEEERQHPVITQTPIVKAGATPRDLPPW
ncbi:hypothetical protein BGZ72_006906 [Mortierella alpina]|nr:hypothetical protein BGZ72_006906 [Mortierella alpina]